MTTALLLLADSRLPSGGHAHSGGLEAAVSAGRVRDVTDLAEFLSGRLASAGLVTSAFAAAACRHAAAADSARRQAAAPDEPGDGHTDAMAALAALDAEFDARTPSPALRRISRRQGRALLRAGRVMWPVAEIGDTPHHAVALGTVAAAAGLSPAEAALVAAYQAVTGPAGAAVRLLGLDPYQVQALLATLAPRCDESAARAAGYAAGPPAELPAASGPLLDITAEIHAAWEVRLFAS
jgi:urease accessory protein